MDSPLRPGQLIDRTYRIVRPLGKGGFGFVYLALHEPLDRPTALKVPHAHLMSDPDIRARFIREGRLMSRLQHEYIVAVHDLRPGPEPDPFAPNVVPRPGEAYLSMDFVDGVGIASHMAKNGANLHGTDVLRWLRQMAEALNYAHNQGVVHRDLTPDNVMIDTISGNVRMIDFGLARNHTANAEFRTALNMVIGTPGYSAPEQFRGEKETPQSDVYSFASITYQLLTGSLAWEGTDNLLILSQVKNPPTPASAKNPQVPQAANGTFTRGLAVDATQRQASAQEFMAQLESAIPSSFWDRAWPQDLAR